MKQFLSRIAVRWLPIVFGSAVFASVAAVPSIAQIHDKQIFSSTMLEAGWDSLNRPYSMRWEGQGWIGGDKHKFWWKTEGELHNRELEEAEIQLLYSRRITRFFDAQAGIRYDFAPRGRTYAVLGIEGLAPYWFEVGAAMFVDHRGNVSARLEAEYDLLITQKLILKPFAEVNIAFSDVAVRSTGAGITDISVGLQLRYEISREFAPFIEFRYTRLIGETAQIANAGGSNSETISFLIGIRIWF